MKHKIDKSYNDPAQEYLIIVGSPSNTFNGYYFSGLHDDEPAPVPTNTSEEEISSYICNPQTMMSGEVKCNNFTHDVYWANFIYSAVKLVEIGIIRPQPGDILTFMLYVPGYLDRQEIDWEASPYNLLRHRFSPWVRNKKPYDPRINYGNQGAQEHLESTRTPRRNSTGNKPSSTNQHVINHEILMRTTREVDKDGFPVPDGGFHKITRSPQDYMSSICDIPRRISYGSRFGRNPPVINIPPLPNLEIKVLFLKNKDDLYPYLATGQWAGKRMRHLLETYDEDDMDLGNFEECTWTDFYLFSKSPSPYWSSAPTVDRTKVKIKRLDYFGHSDATAFFLLYGWWNAKGELPAADVFIENSDLEPHLSKSLFTPDAYAKLWGCNLGATGGGSISMADMLANYIKTVIACDEATSYDLILNDSLAMPQPESGNLTSWKTFSHF